LDARPGVLRRRAVSGRDAGQRLRGPQGVVEPLRADRLQGGARAVQGRQAGGLLREFHDWLLGVGRTAGRGGGGAPPPAPPPPRTVRPSSPTTLAARSGR